MMMTSDDDPPIEARAGAPPAGLSYEQWNEYVIDTIRKWRQKPFKFADGKDQDNEDELQAFF